MIVEQLSFITTTIEENSSVAESMILSEESLVVLSCSEQSMVNTNVSLQSPINLEDSNG